VLVETTDLIFAVDSVPAISISARQGIEIAFCPQCRGVWLERGELDKLIERASRYGGDDDDDDRRHRSEHRPEYDHDRYDRKPKSFWTQLFD
jgi:Zn-finger nucleic acid-binding protein